MHVLNISAVLSVIMLSNSVARKPEKKKEPSELCYYRKGNKSRFLYF